MNVTINRAIGSTLRQIRESKDLRQIEIAEILGVQQSFVSKVESGERALKFSEVFVYAAALGVDPRVILDESAVALQTAAEVGHENWLLIFDLLDEADQAQQQTD